jgi:glycosyltransferase involved in cell wall biosynthesis
MSKALQRAGHDVCVYTEDARAPSARRFTRTNEDGVEIWAIHNERRNAMWWILDRALKPLLGRRFFTTLDAINRYITESRCDVYMVEGDALGLCLALLNYLRPLRWVLCVHDHEYLGVRFGYVGEPANPKRENIKRWVLERATRVRANSHVTKEVLIRAGINASKIHVVPLHWISRMIVERDLGAFRVQSRREIAERHALPPEPVLVLASCRLTPFKGLELAVQVMADVLRLHSNARLLICGADRRVPGVGSYRALLEAAAAAAGVSHCVLYIGDVPTEMMKTYYAAADVHVAPSHLDTFNYSALEAALAGTPSVLTETVGSGPWLQGCGAAAVVTGRDSGAFAAAVVKAVPEHRGVAATAEFVTCVQQTLSPDALASEVAGVLERACGPR